jgi:hypothetical protein
MCVDVRHRRGHPHEGRKAGQRYVLLKANYFVIWWERREENEEELEHSFLAKFTVLLLIHLNFTESVFGGWSHIIDL